MQLKCVSSAIGLFPSLEQSGFLFDHSVLFQLGSRFTVHSIFISLLQFLSMTPVQVCGSKGGSNPMMMTEKGSKKKKKKKNNDGLN